MQEQTAMAKYLYPSNQPSLSAAIFHTTLAFMSICKRSTSNGFRHFHCKKLCISWLKSLKRDDCAFSPKCFSYKLNMFGFRTAVECRKTNKHTTRTQEIFFAICQDYIQLRNSHLIKEKNTNYFKGKIRNSREITTIWATAFPFLAHDHTDQTEAK